MEQDQNINQPPQPPAEPVHVPEDATTGTTKPAPIAKEAPSTDTPSNTQDFKPETEPMEVHKHPHHVMHKKKWIEYMLEFFMLFLAVFLGFIAENVREHIVEKNRAREFARTLVNDLRTDSAEFTAAIVRKELCVHGIDTLIHVLRRPDYQNQISEITRLFSYIRNNYYVTRHDATEQQLVASGSLRYYNPDLYNGITNYYSDVRTYNETNNLYYLRVPIIDQLSGIFNLKDGTDSSLHDHDITEATQWMPNHTMELNRFITYSVITQSIYAGQIKILEAMRAKANRLSGLVDKQYHLGREEE